ncbi:hypothetical protein H4S08_001693 [Coemansia sp. RSA 1365]|nr:hypothetical protein H4S08_001693 [Coemansia sp. RSA 1365]
MPPKKKARGGRPARGKRGASTGTTASRRRIPTRSTVVEEENISATEQTQSATADDKKDGTSIQELATKHWLGKSAKWSEELVRKITLIHIVGTDYSRSNLQLLERQQYFEQYLWPCYSRDDVDSEWLVMAILLILNEKFLLRLHTTTWAVFETTEGSFARLFNDIVKLSTTKLLQRANVENDASENSDRTIGGLDLMSARSVIAQFLIVCFRSIETGFVRDALMPMVSISIWHHIEGNVLMEEEFKRVPQLRKFWKHVNKKYRRREKEDMMKQDIELFSDLESQRDFVPNLIRDFLCCLFPRDAATEIGKLAYCVKFLELLADVLSQLATRRFVNLDAAAKNTHFAGWTRMALPMRSFDVTDVRHPRIGEKAPSLVRADISVDLSNYVESIVNEWDSEVRAHDVLILCSVQARGQPGDVDNYVVRSVRGCEVECRLDAKGQPIDERADEDAQQRNKAANGRMRYFRVLLDKHQYYSDMQQDSDVYAALNVVLRRRPQENNFKGALESIRELMLQPAPLPDWFSSTFLGYGDPAAAAALSLQKQPAGSGVYQVEFGDTFVDEEHLRASFPSYDVEFVGGAFAKPCVIEFPGNAELSEGNRVLRVMHRPEMDMGPIELRGRRENIVRFTPAQIEAIQSAGCEGLTLVVGPPGSGKTDVAVQIISNLYHAHPRQTILLVTHSNQALNQLFAKIIDLDIEPRHLLRLGHGEGELDSDERYSKAGRVDSYLERRSVLLAEVQRLADSLGLGMTAADFAYTCENARFFFISHVRVRWEQYRRKVLDTQPPDESKIMEAFPFVRFIEEQLEQLGRPLFDSNSMDAGKLVDTAYGCFRYIESIFDELADIQPFELLRGHSERSNYLLTNQARIVAMTCTHAALKRGELLRLGFRYDTVVMEEAAQVLDIESLIPLTLQRHPKQTTGNAMDVGRRRLKRLVMIGDHNQLPPVIRNTGLRSYANMEQSMFTRLIRLNVPYIELNMQARARPQLASLYRFRYRDLGDLLPNVSERAFSRPNPGFLHELQFIDVGDFGKYGGESEPTSHFFQNVGEAEYVVAVYQYMRLLGYPADRIAILTTYNGQRALIRDVLERRCGWLPYFGYPVVSTVDQFQGQQADYILLSLVRTKNIGHIRDLRRLTVALSRARLGLYVFARKSLFESCFELKSTMKRLLANGDCLELCKEERFDLDKVWQENEDLNQKSMQQRETVTVDDVKAMGRLVHKIIEEHIANDNHLATEDDVDMDDSSDSSPENADESD